MWGREGILDTRRLEGILQRVLVPVEPSARFARRLRSRLAGMPGGRWAPAWLIVGLVVLGFLLVVALVTFVLRFLLAGNAVWSKVRQRLSRHRPSLEQGARGG
jgi:hypothetical protein